MSGAPRRSAKRMNDIADQRPIGIFDSGVGGLTVYREIRRRLPFENTLYLGDTARIPYGTKSFATVQRYALENSRFLARLGIKMLVVACNTASALALPAIESAFDIPVLGVIRPGAEHAVAATQNKRVGVIGTLATMQSGAYTRAIHDLNSSIEVFSRACPLFVPLAEEGEVDTDITRSIARKYLIDLKDQNIDTLVLGCTHYPILKKVIAEVMGSSVTLIDSAESVAESAARILASNSPLKSEGGKASKFYVTDSAARFQAVAELFLGKTVEHLEAVEVWGSDELRS